MDISIISREISCKNQDPSCIKISMLPPKKFKPIVGKAIQKFLAVKWPIEIRSSIRVGLLKFTQSTGLPKARGNLDHP